MNRRTKIVATIGPASEDEATLRAMIRAGMDVARLGLAHNTIDEGLERFHRIRKVSEEEDTAPVSSSICRARKSARGTSETPVSMCPAVPPSSFVSARRGPLLT